MTSSWMLVAGFFFAGMGVLVKLGSAHFDAVELAFYRSLGSLLFVTTFIVARRGTVRSPYLATHLIRSTAGALGLTAYFYAITQIPLATATTLNYTSPLFLAVATAVVLGERFSAGLLAAVLLGFAGVGMLLQPTFAAGKEGAAMVGLFSGLLGSWAYLSVRTLGRHGEPEWRILFWFAFLSTLLCLTWQAAFSTFHPVRADNVGILAGVAVMGTAGQLCMTRAYRTGNTLAVGALSYSTIVFATVFTVLIWNETLSLLAWAGMVVIVGSGILAMRVERPGTREGGRT